MYRSGNKWPWSSDKFSMLIMYRSMHIFKRLLRQLLPRALASYMALASSILSIVLTTSLVFLVQRKAIDQVEQNIGRALGELADQTADKLDRGMFERYREISLVARHIADFDPRTEGPRRRRLLDDAIDSYKYYSWLGIAALDGTVLTAARGMLEGSSVVQRPWFSNALSGNYVGDVHDAVKLAELERRADGPPVRFVDVAFPILNREGKPEGVLGAHLSWQWAHDVERSVIQTVQAGRQVQALIVDAKGVVLLGPPELQGERLSLPSIDRARQRKGVGSTLEIWPDGVSYLVGYSQTRGYADYPGLGWIVLLRQSADNAYRPVRSLAQYALWTGVSLALLFSLAGALVANWITQPLRALQKYADRIRAGESAPSAAGTHAYDEVSSLSTALDTLLADLLRRGRQLEALNATLEERVEQRTVELSAALDAVRHGAQRIQTIVESAHDAFVGMDHRGIVTDWNNQAERMLGWTRNEAVGRALGPLMLSQALRECLARSLNEFRVDGIARSLGGRIERTIILRSGAELPVEMSIGLAGSGADAVFSIFMRDISQRKRIDQLKNELVATVSHELRTPLTSMRASLSLLKSHAANAFDAETRELLDIAYRHCERLVRMVNDMLDFEKLASESILVKPRPVLVLPLMRDGLAAIHVQAAEADVALALETVPSMEARMAELDPDRIMQVMLNLLSNAVKFAPCGSVVEVSVIDGDGRVWIRVADRGPGIPPGFRARVFERFAQADTHAQRQPSSGLGLAISRQIVLEHGGELRFSDREGGGTVFEVELPLMQPLRHEATRS